METNRHILSDVDEVFPQTEEEILHLLSDLNVKIAEHVLVPSF